MTSSIEMKTVLMESLHLASAPVAISFCDEAPCGAEAPATRVAAGCGFWETGASHAAATTAAHPCAAGKL